MGLIAPGSIPRSLLRTFNFEIWKLKCLGACPEDLYSALQSNTTGFSNTASGVSALASNTEGNRNTASGFNALFSNTTGNFNTARGVSALASNTTGFSNTASGALALFRNTGNFNTASGRSALRLNTSGSNNIALGSNAGVNATTGDANIYIGNAGVAGEATTIKIGTSGTQTKTFIAGIRGVTTGVANAIPVLVDGSGQLGTVSSSRRYKEEIQDMAESSSGLMQLRPVTFRYTRAYANGECPVQPGLIAEEVFEVYPDLVVHDRGGEIETVQYQKLIPMLLNELQKQERKNQIQEKQITDLKRRLELLETDRAPKIAQMK